MADAVVSAVVQQLLHTTAKQIQNEVNLVRGLEKELSVLSNDLILTQKVLEDAEKKKYKEGPVRLWLKNLEATCYEMEDVLDEWDYHILKQQFEVEPPPNQKVCSFIPSSSSCFFFKKVSYRRRIAMKIKEVKDKLESVLKEKERYGLVESEPTDRVDGVGRVPSTPSVDMEKICGRDDDRETLLSKFLGNEEDMGIQIISVVGLGGIGKTTLTQQVFNDGRVEQCYPLRIWICVSDPFDQSRVVKEIIQSITESCPDANQLSLLLGHLKDVITGKKFLLVLDDVWTEELKEWEPLRDCLNFGRKGSKILVTTRNERVAKMMGTLQGDIHRVQVLSDDDCWLILSRIALFDKSETEQESFKKIGKEIANKCKGLPLAAKVLGSVLCFKTALSEWEDIAKSQMWELEETKVDLFPHLILSYNELSPTLRRCFSYCGIFPEDFAIDVEFLINNWSALGYLGSITNTKLRGRDYLNNLVMRSLLHEFERDRIEKHVIIECKVHDIVRDFARYIRNDASDGVVKANCQDCSSTTISKVEAYRSLHCFDEPPKVICECMRGLRVFSVGRSSRQAYASFSYDWFPRGIEKLIHLRELNITSVETLGMEDLKAICKLYHLKILTLHSCKVQELPKEIGNLTRLEHLDLSRNENLKEMPESIGTLHELRYLNISDCRYLSRLPQGIQNLTKLEILHNENSTVTDEGVSHLIGLCKLDEFKGKLSDLKKLNQLRGELRLRIQEFNDVREAREAEMKKKEHLQRLVLQFPEKAGAYKNKDWMGVLDALEPHQNIDSLDIALYRGSKFPNWLTSPHNHVKKIELWSLPKLESLPAFGNLPCLEVLQISYPYEMEVLGGEFLGITRASGNAKSCSSSMVTTAVVVFPMLKELTFHSCMKWKVWEDITIEEEASATLSLFPSLQMLSIIGCNELRELPHRLLRSASSLKHLKIGSSPLLKQHYDKNEEGSAWNSISHIPNVYY